MQFDLLGEAATRACKARVSGADIHSGRTTRHCACYPGLAGQAGFEGILLLEYLFGRGEAPSGVTRRLEAGGTMEKHSRRAYI